MTRVTVWNEHRQERSDAPRPGDLPGRDPRRDRRRACASAGFDVRTATLDEPEHGLTDAVLAETDVLTWWGHVAHAEVDDAVVDRVQRAGPRRDGPDRPPLRPPLEDLPAPDGHDLRPEVARGRRARADLGRRPVASDRRRASASRSSSTRRRCTASTSTSRRRTGSCSSAGSRAARSSGAAAATRRGRGRIFYFRPGHETHPTYFEPNVRRVIANAVRWAARPRAAAPDRSSNRPEPLEPFRPR